MYQNHPAPDNERPGQPPASAVAAMASPPHGSAARLQVRHLAKTGGWSGGERLRSPWYRLRLVIVAAVAVLTAMAIPVAAVRPGTAQANTATPDTVTQWNVTMIAGLEAAAIPDTKDGKPRPPPSRSVACRWMR